MTTQPPRAAVRLGALALVVPLAVLTACTGSGGSPGGPSGSKSAGAASGSLPPSTGGAAASTAGSAPAGGAASAGDSVAPGPTAAATGIPTAKPPASARTTPAPPKPVSTLTVQGAHRTYRVRIWARDSSRTCADHAYGVAVVRFLRKHRCRSLHRVLGTTSVKGHSVGFAVSRVTFPGPAVHASNVAGDLQLLLEKPGAGNIVDLLNDGARLPSGPTAVPAGDTSQALFQDNQVTTADAWYLKGATGKDDPNLVEALADLVPQL